jgi:hypothetical protein
MRLVNGAIAIVACILRLECHPLTRVDLQARRREPEELVDDMIAADEISI